MNYPLISVIMPSYNSGSTIERAILSIMNQTYPNTEVIVVDNSSKDDSVQLALKLAEEYLLEGESTNGSNSRIRVIVQPNTGVSSARNAGIHAASGAFFVSLDSDDYYEPDTLMKLYQSLTEQDADVCIGGMRKVYEWDAALNETFAASKAFAGEIRDFIREMFTELYDLHLISTHSNKLYKTQIVREKNIYYNQKLAVNEDIDFVLRYLAECRRVSVLTDVFLNYVQHKKNESLINTFQPHGLEGALIVLHSCDALMERTGVEPEIASLMDERLFVHICSFAGLMYYRSGYSDAKIREEIGKLCEQEDFKRLLKRYKPAGLKNSIAHFMLKNRMASAYHCMCRRIYKNKD